MAWRREFCLSHKQGSPRRKSSPPVNECGRRVLTEGGMEDDLNPEKAGNFLPWQAMIKGA